MPVELVKNWYCPNCSVTHQSQGPKTAMHECDGFNRLLMPLTLEGKKVKHSANLREDYLGKDLSDARDNSGNVVSSISHETDEGIGATIFLPCATYGLKGNSAE